MLGHSRGTMTSRYVHVVDATLLAAADRVSGAIARAMAGEKPATVVKLGDRASGAGVVINFQSARLGLAAEHPDPYRAAAPTTLRMHHTEVRDGEKVRQRVSTEAASSPRGVLTKPIGQESCSRPTQIIGQWAQSFRSCGWVCGEEYFDSEGRSRVGMFLALGIAAMFFVSNFAKDQLQRQRREGVVRDMRTHSATVTAIRSCATCTSGWPVAGG